MISETLKTGRQNAIKGSDLAALLNVDLRQVTAQIERERREGKPICANRSGGYYMAANRAELVDTIKSLQSRIKELSITSNALIDVLELLPLVDGIDI